VSRLCDAQIANHPIELDRIYRKNEMKPTVREMKSTSEIINVTRTLPILDAEIPRLISTRHRFVHDITGKNLNWYWNSWYFGNNYIDLAIGGVEKAGNGYTVVLNNIGGMPTPVDLEAHYGDGSNETIHETAAIWAPNQRRATVTISTSKTLQSLGLNGGIWVDADSTNNRWTQR
jgi:hypothetical protein